MLALAGAVAAAEDERPAAFIVVNLRGHAPVDDKTSVGVQRHDLSLPGFTNGRGDWQAFPGHEHLFATSTPLPFGNSYDDLIGGLANLPDVPLGRDAMQQAARVLSAYDPATTTDHRPLKRALASLKVMLSEVHRLQPIQETVSKGWLTGARVKPEHLPYIDHWDTMFYEIIRTNRTGGKWEDGPFTEMLARSANIRSKEEALAVVDLLLNADFEQVLMAHGTRINLE
uniref:Uncharacterized protein n=1 Tax=Avena sativa TaxID=4498 RepID=A0ACD5XTN1_AVESA